MILVFLQSGGYLQKMERLLPILLNFFSALLALVPYRISVQVIALLIRGYLIVFPKYRRIGLKNLSVVFPEATLEWKREVLSEHCVSLARLLVDFFRIPLLTKEWMQTHIEFPDLERFKSIKTAKPNMGAILLGGHSGSFDVLPVYLSIMVAPVAFVVRSFKPKSVDEWATRVRCLYGNRVIQRKGALKGILRYLNKGSDIGLLFDQNVRRHQAVFVDWFGKPAATTGALGLAALRTEAPIVLLNIITTGWDKYRVEMCEVNCSDIYQDPSMSSDAKVLAITQRAVSSFEKIVINDPPAWFWLHRRWRTTPTEDEPENFYDDCR